VYMHYLGATVNSFFVFNPKTAIELQSGGSLHS
jgi:hypothetical protein